MIFVCLNYMCITSLFKRILNGPIEFFKFDGMKSGFPADTEYAGGTSSLMALFLMI